MNQGNHNLDIRIPEMSEDLTTKKKSKLALVLSLSAIGIIIIAAAIIGAMLYMPLITTSHWENTWNKVFYNTSEMQSFSDNLSDGFYADITFGLDNEITGLLQDVNLKLSIANQLKDNGDAGSLTLALEEGDNTLALSLIYNKETVAIGIYDITESGSPTGEAYASFPRNNITEEFKNSVFAPDSGTEFAISQEIFDEIINVLESFEEIEQTQENDTTLEDSLTGIYEQITPILKPKSSISLSDSEFALVREISVILTKEDICFIIDVIIDEAEKNGQFAAMLDPSYPTSIEGIDQTSFIELLKEAKEELPKGEMRISYTVSGDYVQNLKYSFDATDGSEEDFDAVLDFVYGESSGFDLKITYGSRGDDSITYRKADTDTELKAELNLNIDNEDLTTSVTLNKNDDSLLILASSTDSDDSKLELRGTLKYDKDSSVISLSFESIKIGNEKLFDNLLMGIEFGKSEKEISVPDAIPLFSLTASDIEALISNLPKETFAKILKNCTGQDLESYFSADGKLMLNADQYAEIATTYANAYSVYLANAEIMRADAVYIPVPELGINILLNYDQKQNVIFYNFAYNMTDTLLAAYHPVFVDENGNLGAHNIIIKSDKEASCTEAGATVYGCTLCDKTLTVNKDMIFHTWADNTLKFTADNGQKYSANYWYCSVCNFISNFEIVGQMSASFTYNRQNGTYSIESYNFRGGTLEKYYGIPHVFDEIMTFSDVKYTDLQGCISVRIPYGIQILNPGRFASTNDVQVLILPSTLKEIKKGFFPSYENLHTVFFCGTKEQWEKVELGNLKDMFDGINIVFCPNGTNASQIQNAIIDPEKADKSAADAKNKVTTNIKSAENAAKSENIHLIHKGRVENVIYDSDAAVAAVCGVFNGSTTAMTIYDLNTFSAVESFTISGDVTQFDIREGYIAYACEGSTEIHIHNIQTKQAVSYKAPSYSEISWDSIAAIYIHNGKVYTSTVEQHCYLSYYDLTSGDIVIVNQILYPDIYINRELNRIVNIKKSGSPKTVEFYDLETNKLIKEIWLENRAHYITFEKDYLVDSLGNIFDLNGESLPAIPVGSEPLAFSGVEGHMLLEGFYAETDGNMSLTVKKDYSVYTVLKSATGESTVILNHYAEKAIVTESGDFLIYTPDGYGLILVKMK